MNVRRLKRPLLAVAVTGALLAGGALAPTAAFADDSGRGSVSDAAALLSDEPEPTVTPTTDAPTPEPTPTTDAPTPEPTPTTDAPTPDPTPTTDAPTPEPTPTTDAPTPEPTPTTDAPTTTPPVTTPPPAPDKTAPKGLFGINTGSLWVGQRVTFTQKAVTDNVSPAAQIARVVSWGDGTSTTLKAVGQAPLNKQYTRNGKFTITLTVKDKAGNIGRTTAVVNVTTPGKWKLDKYNVWSGERITVNLSAVPAGTTRIVFNWGDGYVGDIKPKNQSFKGLYYHRKNGALIKGKVTLRAAFYNKFGSSSAIYVGAVNVKTDSWKPVVKVNKPKSANRIKSWKTVTGTVSDKGSGVPYVYVWVSKISGNKVYCYTPQKKWQRVYTEAQYNNCAPIAVQPVKGKWSVKVNGLTKSTIYVDAVAWDWADKQSKWSSVKSKLTAN